MNLSIFSSCIWSNQFSNILKLREIDCSVFLVLVVKKKKKKSKESKNSVFQKNTKNSVIPVQ